MRGSLIVAATVTILAGCSTYDSITQKIAQHITPYRITVVQGNFVSHEAAAQMQVGMTRDQVKALLGTPLLADMFHADRWDYIFYFKRGSTAVVQQRDFIVTFNGDKVAGWTGGEDLPSNLELLAEIDGDKGRKLSAITSSAASDAAASAATAAAVPTPAPGTAAPGTAESGSITQPNAAAALANDANQQAAQAANRATSAVTSPKPGTRSSAFSAAPTNGGVPPNVSASGNSQIQLHRNPDPALTPDNSNAVGPQGVSAGSNGQATFTVPPASN